MTEAGKSLPAAQRFMGVNGANGGRTGVKVSLLYARVKVCPTVTVNLLLKITSDFSRGLCEGADTETDPCGEPRAEVARSRARQATGSRVFFESGNGSTDLTQYTV